MKAEPQSRMEKGIDVKFSIDDLASRTEPEGWDGKSTITLGLGHRAAVARIPDANRLLNGPRC